MNHPPKTITSPANPTVKMLASLAQKKYRAEYGLFLVEGARHVADALAGGFVPAYVAISARAQDDAQAQAVLRDASAAGATLLDATDDILRKITGRENTQALIAALPIPHYNIDSVTDGVWVALDRIRDPGNLGTIIRTAAATGTAGVILVGDCCDAWQPETVRATMGLFARQRIVAATEADFTTFLQDWPGDVTGTHLHERAVDYRKADYNKSDYGQRHILLMGAEQTGLSPALTAACRQLVKIPMADGVESLNLAVSTGIMLYEITRARF
jgi:TrmH family RNA methyltransferase